MGVGYGRATGAKECGSTLVVQQCLKQYALVSGEINLRHTLT